MKFTGRIREPEKLTASFPALKLPLSGGYEEGYADGRTAGYTEGEQAARAEAVAHNAAILTDCNAVLPTKGVEPAETLEQVPQRIGKIPSYADGYKDGGNGILSMATGLGGFFSSGVYPDGTEIEVYCPNFMSSAGSIASNTKGLRKLTLKCDDTSGGVNFGQAFNGSSVEVLDISQFKHTPNGVVNCFLNSRIKTIIGALDCSLLTATTNFFAGASNLVDVGFVPSTIKVGISFSSCSKLSDTSIQSIIEGLADLTGQTAQTLTFHRAVYDRLTEEQKATIAAKNWTLVRA